MSFNLYPQYKSEKEARLGRWAREYFYEKLTAQGFVSYQDKGLSWYKLVNNSIIQTVYLYSDSGSSFLNAAVGYSCHPLFIPAPLPQKLTITGTRRDTVLMKSVALPYPRIFDLDSRMMYTNSAQGGAEVLDAVVFPRLEPLRTIEDAYEMHRQQIKQRINTHLAHRSWADYNGMVACREFMDMLIFMGDQEMLPYVDRDLSPSFCRTEKERRWVEQQRSAIRDGKRDNFLKVLEKRQTQFVTKLESKVGIIIRSD